MISRHRGSDEALGVSVFVVAAVVYLGALRTGFSGDDYFILARLEQLNGLHDPLVYFTFGFFDYYRPIAFLSHALDWQLWGALAFGFHLTNVLLHAVNSALVFMLGRRLTDSSGAYVAALLFALHPASHEAVYWMAARFDLLATCFSLLAILWLRHDGRLPYTAGLIAFFMALLSKESALAVLIIAPAYDVIVSRRDGTATLRRVLPLLVVAGVYAGLRTQTASLAVAGGTGKLPKLLMVVAGLVAIVWLARRQTGDHGEVLEGTEKSGRAATRAGDAVRAMMPGLVPMLAVAAAIILLGLAFGPTSVWMREKLGFVTYAAFYLVSPVVLPAPPIAIFEPPSWLFALVGAAAALAVLAMLRRSAAWLQRVPAGAFLCVFIAAALLPVSSMTGGTRYLYLASAGAALLVGVAARTWTPSARRRGVALLVIVLLVSWAQIEQAFRNWQWASTMTTNGLALMARDLEPCRKKEIILLTAPVGIRSTYCNFYWDAFEATTECPPAAFLTVLRVVRHDATVEIRTRSEGVLELRVPHYRDQIVASTDLRHFDRPVRYMDQWAIDTPAGRLVTRPEESAPDDPVQVFTLTLSPHARHAGLFYYSGGEIRAAR